VEIYLTMVEPADGIAGPGWLWKGLSAEVYL
jgi:hypothetical protein